MAGIENWERWVTEDGRRVEKIDLPTAEPPLCDFCSEPEVSACFLSEDAGLGLERPEDGKRLLLTSTAHWSACSLCAPLVRTMDHEVVAARSDSEFKRKHPDEYGPEAALSLRLVQETMFWAGFTGKEHPLSEPHE